MPVVNNITRLLEARKIAFQAFELPVEKLGARETADHLGIKPELVYKTIVVTRTKGKPILAIIPGNHRLNLKRTADCVNEKKVFIPTERDAEALTGLQVGGISPLALINKGFSMFISSKASSEADIHISGGQRGLIIRLPVNSLIEIIHARFADISDVQE
jgi:Cys-tRNA(Pro)/Cys-tRNA(Cys) deacylase